MKIPLPQKLGTQPFDPGLALMGQADYNEAYALSLSPERRAYMALPYNSFGSEQIGAPTRTRPDILPAEAAKGHLDTQIQVWGWDPQMTMTVRIEQGYSWVPSFGMSNIPIGPGLSMPDDSTQYDPANPPAGAILVPKWDTNGFLMLPAPFEPVTPPVPPPVVAMAVGSFQFAGINPLDGNQFEYLYGVVGGTKPTIGQIVTGPSGQKFECVPYPMMDPMEAGQVTKMWKLLLPSPAA